MGRARGSGNVFDAVIGRASGIPTPIMPTENVGIISGSMRKRGGRRRDERGSRKGGIFGGSSVAQVTMKDPKTGRLYGGMVKDGVPQFEKPDFVSDEDFNKSFPTRGYPAIRPDGKGIKEPPPGMKYDEADRLVPREFDSTAQKEVEITRRRLEDQPGFDPSKPSAVQETTRVNVQDPTLGGPPEREVPLPKEKDMTPRGPAPFAPNEADAAKQRFFETMFERASNRKERSGIDKAEMRDRQEARRDEAMMRDSEMGGRRRGRRDFTRRRPERRRSREERAAFRDRYVSTLGSNFFS
tara:strand:- start:16 stop:906 length:891 start_codon:yes stop_codon:yes gene_type:complete